MPDPRKEQLHRSVSLALRVLELLTPEVLVDDLCLRVPVLLVEAVVPLSVDVRLPDHPPRIVLVFPGQGAQWLGMGRRLLAEEPAFAEAIAACEAAVAEEAGFSLVEELWAEPDASRMARIDVR